MNYMDILDDMGVSKLSAKVFFKVNFSFNLGTANMTPFYQKNLLMCSGRPCPQYSAWCLENALGNV